MPALTRLFGALPVLWLAAGLAQAAPLLEGDVPQPLRPWIGWVLHDQDARTCPLAADATARRLCQWPSALRLTLDERGGSFEFDAQLYARGWLELPGDARHWPQDLSVDGAPAPVALHDGLPMLALDAGRYRIRGAFRWRALPDSLRVPGSAGLLSLSVNGAARPHPSRDTRSHVWLGKAAAGAGAPGARHLGLKVFRLLDDSIPPRVFTHIQIEAAGEVRDEVIGPVLLPGLIPMTIRSDLPARLDEDRRLHVQVRPGVWSIDVTARAAGPLAALTLPQLAAPWPVEEVWSYQARPELRVAEVSGAPAIDPRQTQMPPGWHGYPAFLVEPGTTLAFAEKQRGAPHPEPDELSLSRQLWLDFDGRGYTAQDQLQGRLSTRWRLDAAAPLALGRVQVDGEPQLITRSGDSGTGVEVRHGTLSLSADSRFEGALRRLPVSGWSADLRAVETTLHLPPGWRLLAAPGADNVPDTWIGRWTLLDLFIVLIAAIAALRLFGWRWSALSLLTLALIWHEPNAPRWSWLNLIAAIALARALPASLQAGRLPRWLNRYRWASALALVLLATPFAIQQARTALYPQLENYSEVVTATPVMFEGKGRDEMQQAESDMPSPAAPPMAMQERSAELADSARMVKKEASRFVTNAKVSQQSIQRMDPNVLTQTGPGLPEWRWQQAQLSWSGPVASGQDFRLLLQPPWLTRLLRVASILLIGAVLARWMDLRLRLPPLRPAGTRATVGLLLPLLALMLVYAPRASAQESSHFPPQALLDELRQRLLAAPACAPNCVQVTRMGLSLSGDTALSLRLRIDAQVAGTLPLPVPALAAGEQGRVWQPEQVLLDGQPAGLRRVEGGVLWLAVPAGRHEAVISGSLAGFSQLQLPLPLKPREVVAEVPGWAINGIGEHGELSDALLLLRNQPATGESAPVSGDAGQALPPLLIVTRTLHLGLSWDVETQVERVGVTHTPVAARIALLPGEAVTGEGVRVRAGAVEVSMAPGQTQTGWTSRLPVTEKLELKAAADPGQVEVWRVDVSPLWHAQFEGLTPIQHQADDYWLPTYQPWPGESVRLTVSRPQGVQGRTLTLDNVALQVAPGRRARDYTLSLRLRASQGGQHAIALPEGYTLQGLSVDGVPQPARQEGARLILPLHPGEQNFAVSLRSAESLGLRLVTPELDLGMDGVNARIDVEMPPERWLLLVGGPQLGPAVLFWGLLAVLLLIAVGLGRLPLTPLRTWHWVLLLIGLSQAPVWSGAIVAGWLVALGLRARIASETSALRFNLAQIALALLTVVSLGLLFSAVADGLLGAPDMQIAGNDSYGQRLHWFQDRFASTMPQAWVISVPLWVYRVLMLAWALWMANALLAWLRWGWAQFTLGGYWRRTVKATSAPAA